MRVHHLSCVCSCPLGGALMDGRTVSLRGRLVCHCLERPRCTPGLRFYQWMMEKNRRARLWNQERLRELRRDHQAQVTIFSGHDPIEFERLAGRRMDMPAAPAQGRAAERPATTSGDEASPPPWR